MKKIRALALSTFAAISLLSATGADARPMQMCPMIYRPVCAITPAGPRKTFANSCIARAGLARVLYDGRCRVHRR